MAESPMIVQKASLGFSEQLVALFSRFELAADATRTYDGIALRRDEFVADSEDRLAIIFYVHNKMARSPLEVMKDYTIKTLSFEFTNNSDNLFHLEEDTEYQQPGEKRYFLSSIQALAFVSSHPSPLYVNATAELESTKTPKKEPLKRKDTVLAQPCYLYAKLWVVPGKRRGTSDAGACIGVRLPREPWYTPKQRMQADLLVTNPGGEPTLSPGVVDGVTMTESTVEVSDGFAKWTLNYAGMTLDNVAGADFLVRVRLARMAKEATVHINVGRNLVEFLTELNACATMLELTNFEFQHDPNTFIAFADYLWPDHLLGPLYNARCALSDTAEVLLGTAKTPKAYRHYTCGDIAGRIIGWMDERRHGHHRYNFDTAQRMNGIEFGEYCLRLVHEFIGFHLSGAPILGNETRMIDPWWRQAYDDHVMLSEAEEMVRLYAAVTALITGAAAIAIFFQHALVATILRFSPSLAEALRSYIYSKVMEQPWRRIFLTLDMLALVGNTISQPDIFFNDQYFDDKTEMSYKKCPVDWLEQQAARWIKEHAGGRILPYME